MLNITEHLNLNVPVSMCTWIGMLMQSKYISVLSTRLQQRWFGWRFQELPWRRWQCLLKRTKRHPGTIFWFPITNVYSSNDMYEDYLHTYFQATQVSGSSYFWHHVNKNVHLSKNKIVYNIFCSSDGWLVYSSCACLWCSNVNYSDVLAWKHLKKCVQRSLVH